MSSEPRGSDHYSDDGRRDPLLLPSALDAAGEIHAAIEEGGSAIFLDYDGTLTPIVGSPELAQLNKGMRKTITQVARRYTVSVVSGRDLHDIKGLVGLHDLIYVGSHGLDIEGPGGLRWEHEEARAVRRPLENARSEIERRLRGIEGVLFETKRFSLAVHFRNTAPEDTDKVVEAVEAAGDGQSGLKVRLGKMVAELQPDVAWNKGSAIEWLLEALGLDGSRVRPIYIGDDLTDEDAFRALSGSGFGVIVGNHGDATWASHHLQDTDEVEGFLKGLVVK